MPLSIFGPSRIQRKLLTAFLCVTLIPLVGVGIYSVHFTISLLERTAVESMASRTLLRAREIERLLIDAKSDMFFLGQTPSLRSLMEAFDRGAPDQIEFLRRKVGQQFVTFAMMRHLYSEIAYLDHDGREVLRIDSRDGKALFVEQEKLHNRENDHDFVKTLTLPSGQIYGPELRNGEQREEPTIRYAVKVFGRKGVITTDLRAGYLLNIVSGTDGMTLLVDGNGNHVAGSGQGMDYRYRNISDVLSPSTVSRILAEPSGVTRDDPTWIIS
ncbi:MAG: cache domain-containing protein, partial [Candidatus Latescibacteria bacterium]|nr:cache domain-containing protein [Candidatus Latescibacterota bacterium]